MTKEELALFESPAVIKHIEILQDTITRMANNSASCKAWTLTIVTGIAALFFNKSFAVFLGIVPILLFFMLDSLYLGLEQQFRDIYGNFVEKLGNGQLKTSDIYEIVPKEVGFNHPKCICDGAKSFATYGFYLATILLIVALFCFNHFL